MEERKINIDREPLTSAEIVAKRNFDSVLTGSQPFTKPPFYKSTWFNTGIAVFVVAVTTTVASILINSNEDDENMVVASKTTQSAPDDEFDYEDDTPCVNPPIKEMDLEYSSYFIKAEQGGSLVHTTGSEISIPPFAFEDKDGNELTGEVEIRYREFHDQLDIFFSGIPMTYDSAGVAYNFESAGMLDIQGFQNDQPIKIQSDKEIEVNMSSNNSSPTFNIYYLDQENGRWNYEGKDDIVTDQPEDQVAHLSPEEILELPEIVDCGNRVIELSEQKEEASKSLQKAIEQTVDAKSNKPLKPREVNKERYSFDLAVDPNDFPELSSYKDVVFEVAESEKSFTPQVFDVEWTNATISKKDESKAYSITLSKGKQVKTYEVFPALTGEDYQSALLKFEEKFETYQKELDKRLEFEAQREAEFQEKMKALQDAKDLQKKLLVQYRLSLEEFSNNGLSEQKLSVRTKVSRVFSIMSFGIYNADKTIAAKPNGQKTVATFTDQVGNPLLLENAQLIEMKTNAVYRYSSTEFEKLRWNPKEDNLLLALSTSGDLGFFDADYMRSIPPKTKEHTFKVKLFDASLMSRQELRNKLGY